PHDIGLPLVRTGSALHNVRAATSARRPCRGCSHSLMFRPAGVLTTPVAPTATAYTAWQPWFVRPSLSWVVTSPRPGYACRPNRAIDGRGLSPHKMRSLVGCSPNRWASEVAGSGSEVRAGVGLLPTTHPGTAARPGWPRSPRSSPPDSVLAQTVTIIA